MKRIVRILLFSALSICLFTQYEIFDQVKFGPIMHLEASETNENDIDTIYKIDESNYFVSDSVYRWDELELSWIPTGETKVTSTEIIENFIAEEVLAKPIELDWKILMDIEYKLRYFKELDMEIYAPVFSEEAKALNKKEVFIEGFVIPFDEDGEVLSLSFNPYASCFFCGKASPASIISMHLKDKGKRYKIDDYKKFRGTLHLNYDDPNEFYYILKEAEED